MNVAMCSLTTPGSGCGAAGGLWGLFCWKMKLINVLQTDKWENEFGLRNIPTRGLKWSAAR